VKRGTTRHPKLIDLCQELHCYRPTALGYLTLLWEFAAEYAPAGDVGRYDEKRIEAACCWRGRKGALISALYRSGWVDSTGELWVIHDWSEHCEESVHRWLRRHKMEFVTGQPFRRKVTDNSGTSITEVFPLPLPLPLPLPIKTPPAPPSGGVRSRRLTKKEAQAARFRLDQERRKELEKLC